MSRKNKDTNWESVPFEITALGSGMSEHKYNPDDCHWLRGKRPSIMPDEAALREKLKNTQEVWADIKRRDRETHDDLTAKCERLSDNLKIRTAERDKLERQMEAMAKCANFFEAQRDKAVKQRDHVRKNLQDATLKCFDARDQRDKAVTDLESELEAYRGLNEIYLRVDEERDDLIVKLDKAVTALEAIQPLTDHDPPDGRLDRAMLEIFILARDVLTEIREEERDD